MNAVPHDGVSSKDCGLRATHEAVCQAGEITQEAWERQCAIGLDSGVSVAQTAPDSALSSLAEVAERNGSAVTAIRHAADSAHYSTASWPGMGEWLTGNVPAIRTLADDLAAWCDAQTLARNVPRGTSTADEGA